ncbi:hypothetical protein D3C81_611720 [compost metagenome]
MFKALSKLFGGAGKQITAAPPSSDQPSQAVPSTPLEILVPEGAQLHEAPKLAGKTMSYFVAAPGDINTIEYLAEQQQIGSNNPELKQFLLAVAGAGQAENLFSQCAAVFFPAQIEGSIGDLACLQQGNLYSFAVFEISAHPQIKWEIHRRSRSVQAEPFGPNNSFKPNPLRGSA